MCTVSSVLNPIGPEEPSVYWRRRLIVGLAILVVLIILFVFLRSCSSGGTPVAAPTSSAPVVAPTSSSSSTSSSSPSSSPSSSASGNICPDSAIQVTVQPNNGTSFSAGTPITFTMAIKNTSSQACSRNVGTKPNTVKITSGGVDVWSSDDCAPAGEDNYQTLQPGDMYQLTATWNQKLSSGSQCTNQQSASAGSYDVQGINDQVKSQTVSFTINK